jgi:hypothetical protein
MKGVYACLDPWNGRVLHTQIFVLHIPPWLAIHLGHVLPFRGKMLDEHLLLLCQQSSACNETRDIP